MDGDLHPTGRARMVNTRNAGPLPGSPRRWRPDRGDEGALVAFVLLLLVALMALLGLVVDGGAALTAHQAAEVEAEQAARAGAGAISVDGLRAGSVQLDPVAAVVAAQRFAAATGHPGRVNVVGGVVTVSVRYDVPTTVLGLIGIHTLSVMASASAVDLHGVTTGVR